ncbi:DUF1800 domain-containing protein [Lysobacter silvisoli]|nr:DUF1800 domain-containing protein [Lysobacter silvisoli]
MAWASVKPRLWLLLLVLGVVLLPQRWLRLPTPPPTASGAAASASKPPPSKSGPMPAQLLIEDAAAAHFLAQGTFGPTWDDITRVQQLGYEGWIDEQVSFPVSSQLRFLTAASAATGQDVRRDWRLDAWFVHALGGRDPFDPQLQHRDQLRQRVAFALSEILVISDANSDLLGNAPHGVTDYYDTLARGAFGNYRDLLKKVTLHPTMGLFLSMMQNQKPDAARNIRPDENYAREIMQLFSVGLVRLNPDGTPMLDGNGRPIPTYGQETVKGFAHVFTGWTFDGCREFECYYYDSDAPAWTRPMQNHAAYYASAQSKQLLVYPGVSLAGGVLPAGGTGPADLDAALDNIFNHPNVGPFIGKQLIQRLVTSNPSPSYVARVAARFDNNGQGVRGDMKAVIKAILLDPEARDAAYRPSHFGKVREPLLRLTHLWRAMKARSRSGFMDEFWTIGYGMGQAPQSAPSVFNFFSPTYSPIGEPTQLGLVAPEMQLATDFMLPSTEGYLGNKIYEVWLGAPDLSEHEISVDLSAEMPFATRPTDLINRYNVLFLSGQMSTRMRSELLARLNEMPAATEEDRRVRVQEMLYLIVNSPEYVVQK